MTANAIPLLATILGLVGLAGGAVGYFAKSRGDSIIEYQAKELALRDSTINRLEKDNAALNSKCDSQTEQIATLTSLAQGSPQLIKLTTEVGRLANQVAEFVKKGTSNGK